MTESGIIRGEIFFSTHPANVPNRKKKKSLLHRGDFRRALKKNVVNYRWEFLMDARELFGIKKWPWSLKSHIYIVRNKRKKKWTSKGGIKMALKDRGREKRVVL